MNSEKKNNKTKQNKTKQNKTNDSVRDEHKVPNRSQLSLYTSYNIFYGDKRQYKRIVDQYLIHKGSSLNTVTISLLAFQDFYVLAVIYHSNFDIANDKKV